MDNNETVGLELSSAGEKMLQEELAKLTANSQERLAGFMNSEESSANITARPFVSGTASPGATTAWPRISCAGC